ncbi:MAG: metal-dependent hydrolase [Gemmatimonadaceae bacterium]
MENLAHSLIGATLAELTLPSKATPVQRRLFFVAGIVAANLPDADLLYTRIAPPPLGYLLHHRGYTHTVVGCVALAGLIWLATRLIPPVRSAVAESPRRFWILIATALASHLLADSWNSYGIHPFWPFDNRWFYGDAIFIVEPWLWVILGTAAVLNTRSTSGRRLFGGVLFVLPVAATLLHFIPVDALVALAIGATLLVLVDRRVSRRQRSAIALLAMSAFVAFMFGLNRAATFAVLLSLPVNHSDRIVDIVLSPKPGQPVCWSAVAVEKREIDDKYVVWSGDVAMFTGTLGERCVPAPAQSYTDDHLAVAQWSSTREQSLSQLRSRARSDCLARAWLRFGRVPELTDEIITDGRYGDLGGGSFAEMLLTPLTAPRVCPRFLPEWDTPRDDLLMTDSESPAGIYKFRRAMKD